MTDLEHWWPWVWGVARRVGRRHKRWTHGELASWGYDGLVSGLRRYREQPGWSLRRYLGYRVSGAMADGMRQARWQLLPESTCNVESLPAPTHNDEGFEDLVRHVRAALRPLVVRYYRDGWTLKEVAREAGYTEARISQLLQEARAEVRMALESAAGDSRGESAR